jgi:Carboxypeptidase regulatory-like domain/TonB dependent receptor-like, beta-barrel
MSAPTVLAAAVAILCSVGASVAGQTGQTLQTLVQDETRAVIVGAQATLTVENAEAREAVSDKAGKVMFEGLPPGRYTFRVAAPGFRTEERSITIADAPLAPLTVTLKVEVTEDVSVTATRITRESPNTLVLDRDALDRMPVPVGGAQLMEFLGTVFGSAVQSNSGVTVVIDGVESDALSLPTLAIKSIVVNKNPYSTEYRRPGKARVEVITENGSRRHYEWNSAVFLGNSMLEARNPFAVGKPPTSKTQIEQVFGGPLPGKRAAFLVTGEFLRDRQSRFVHAQTLTGLFEATTPKSDESATGLGRLDLRLSDVLGLMVRYDFAADSERNAGVGGLRLPALAMDDDRRSHGVRIKADALVSASFANDLRVSLERRTEQEGAPPAAARIIVHGAFEGGSNQTFTSETANQVLIQDTATYIHGSHTFRFGGQTQTRFRRASDRLNFGGTFEFSSLALFASGVPTVFRINQGAADIDFAVHDASLFFQDEFKAGSQVTLMAGARYDWQSALHDRDNIAPRVAFSFAPGDGTIVVRGGVGLFYERLSESILQRTLLFDGSRAKELVVRNPSYPDPFAAGAGEVTPASIVRLAPAVRTPSLTQASLSVERRIWRQANPARNPHELFLTVEYAPVHGSHLFRVRNVNAPAPGTNRRPEPALLNIAQVESSAILRSQAWRVGLTGRVWRFKGSAFYNYSLSTNDVGGSLFRFPANNYDLMSELGPADFDVRHRLTTLASVNLPGNGIELGTHATFASGTPFDITTGFDDNGDSEATDRPAGVTRNTGRGPGLAQIDLRLWKKFKLGASLGGAREPREFILRLDAFNVLNRANYDRVIGVMSSPLFGLPVSAKTPRSLQLSLRFRY